MKFLSVLHEKGNYTAHIGDMRFIYDAGMVLRYMKNSIHIKKVADISFFITTSH